MELARDEEFGELALGAGRDGALTVQLHRENRAHVDAVAQDTAPHESTDGDAGDGESNAGKDTGLGMAHSVTVVARAEPCRESVAVDTSTHAVAVASELDAQEGDHRRSVERQHGA